MRLLNCRTMELEEFFHKRLWSWKEAAQKPADYIPNYYILSHCWGEDEISYKDFVKSQKRHGSGYTKIIGYAKGRKKHSAGYTKILRYCQYASERHQVWQRTCDQYDRPVPKDCYVWIDTICIRKDSSAELSDAINSMWKYYQNTIECHVYLADIHPSSDREPVGPAAGPCHDDFCEELSAFATKKLAESRWFTRGWTLQELLAPEFVTFLYSDWTTMGHRCIGQSCKLPLKGLSSPGMTDGLERITSIERAYLTGSEYTMLKASVAKRMSWASIRRTTRKEDEAYCLLGVFDVNMPLLYGEGSNAFRRLQEAIMSRSTDHSLFAYGGSELFASEASHFGSYAHVYKQETTGGIWPYTMTNLGVEFRMQAQRGVLRHEGPSELWGTFNLIHVVLHAHDVRPVQEEAAAQHPIDMLLWTVDTTFPQVYHKMQQLTTQYVLGNAEDMGFEKTVELEFTTFYVAPRWSIQTALPGVALRGHVLWLLEHHLEGLALRGEKLNFSSIRPRLELTLSLILPGSEFGQGLLH